MSWPALTELGDAKSVEEQRRASWKHPGLEKLDLVRGAAGWKIRGGVLLFMRAQTAEQALRKLSQSLLSEDYEALFTLLPASEAKHWTPGRLMKELADPSLRRAWLSLARSIQQNKVVITCLNFLEPCQALVAGETMVSLKPEGKTWKVVDVRPPDAYIPPPYK
jgi:hypothetical protein